MQVDLPSTGVERAEGDWRVVTFPDRAWLRIEILPPWNPPDDWRAWTASALKRGIPMGATSRVVGSLQGRSLHGWPLEMVSVVVLRRDVVIESRLVGLYDMLGHVAMVAACSTDRDQFVREFQSVVFPAVASARPAWDSRKLVALAELWSL